MRRSGEDYRLPVARIAACGALLGAIVAAGTGLAAGTAATATNTVVFRDVTGEEPVGPDITTVAVSSDGTSLSFRLGIPTNPVVTEDIRVRIWLDADDVLETGLEIEGTKTGFDHFLLLDPINVSRFGLPLVGLYWCATSNTCSGRATPEFAYESGPTITLDVSQLNPAVGVGRFERVRFYAVATAGIRFVPETGYDFTDARLDFAPDDGQWTFDARALRVASFRATPGEPRAGRPLKLRLGVLRTDTGTALTGGGIACSLRIGGSRVRAHTSRFVDRKATCVFDVPSTARSKRFTATIAVTARGATVRRSVAGRIR